jgi:hypothetical protein
MEPVLRLENARKKVRKTDVWMHKNSSDFNAILDRG